LHTRKLSLKECSVKYKPAKRLSQLNMHVHYQQKSIKSLICCRG